MAVSRPPPPPPSASQRDEAAPAVIRVHFDVLRIDLPVDGIRHSLKIWNHIDESIGDPSLTALLARNGIRLGVADKSAWPVLQTIFKENGGRSTRAGQTAQDGQPLIVPLGEIESGQTYFLHSRDGKLQGGSFQAGSKRMRIEYALSEDDPLRVILRITPELRENRAKAKFVERGGEIVAVRDHEGQVFDEITATATVNPGQFLVLGGSLQASRRFLLGSLWFTSKLGMQEYETVLCITPQTVRLERRWSD